MPSALWSSTITQPLEVYSGYRSNSPASMAGWMLLVPAAHALGDLHLIAGFLDEETQHLA